MWKRFISEFGVCLVQARGDESSPAGQRLVGVSVRVSRICRPPRASLQGFSNYVCAREDKSRLGAGPRRRQLPCRAAPGGCLQVP